MAQQQIKESNEQLHWFWKLTTKWWFFPVFYITLTLLVLIIIAFSSIKKVGGIGGFFSTWYLIILFMPSGLLALINIFIVKKTFAEGVARLGYLWPGATIHIIHILFMVAIYHAWKKRRKVLKWMVITLLLLMTLEFSGCLLSLLP